MNKKLIIFGIGPIAEIVYYYATEVCCFEVVGFTVDKKFMKNSTFIGKEVVPFEKLNNFFNVNECNVFVAIGYHDHNKIRARKCSAVLKKGFTLTSIIHPKIDLFKSLKIGDNCLVLSYHIQPCVEIGDNVFIWTGAIISHHSIIGNNNWISPGVSIAGNVQLKEYCYIGIGVIINHGIIISPETTIHAGTII